MPARSPATLRRRPARRLDLPAGIQYLEAPPPGGVRGVFMTTQRFIPVSALHEQIAQREARLLEIDEEVVKLTRERASLEQEIKLHRDMEALAVDGEIARPAVPANG